MATTRKRTAKRKVARRKVARRKVAKREAKKRTPKRKVTKNKTHRVPIATVEDYLREVNGLTHEWKYHAGSIWYRGIARESCDLVPGVLWRGVDDEDSVTDEFLISYYSLHGQAIVDHWELYALMQHYGLPTRLLDWTKSPLVALYWALEKEDNRGEARVVWAIDPFAFNKANHGTDTVFTPLERFGEFAGLKVLSYLPKTLRSDKGASLPAKPLAIEPPLCNRRIQIQQGCFTVHGSESKPIDQYLVGENAERKKLFVVEDEAHRQTMLESLYVLGFREDYLYQDLDSLARRIIRERRDSWSPAGKTS